MSGLLNVTFRASKSLKQLLHCSGLREGGRRKGERGVAGVC